jgi:dsDNA-specific endonuclease/ATPase MutS2
VDDALGELVKGKESKKAKKYSIVKRLRAFLKDYQAEKELEVFDLADFVEARYRVSEAWRAHQAAKQLSAAGSA